MTYISQHKVFAHLERVVDWRKGQQAAPVTVEFDLSNVCSLGCQSCHFAHTHVAGPWAVLPREKPAGYTETGKFADPEMVVRVLTEMAQAGVLAVVWSGGGEPTLHPQFPELVESAARVGLQQGMYTLGGHLSERHLHACTHLTWVVVSLDCADAATYAAEKRVPESRFHAACEGVRALARTVPTVGVSFLLHAGNWSQMPRMRLLARELGATYVTFRPTIDYSPTNPAVSTADRSWISDALPSLRRFAEFDDVEVDPGRFVAYRDWKGHGYQTCYGIRLMTMITPDGRMWVCPNRRGVPGSEIGDLRKASFSDVWAQHPRQWTEMADCRVMCRYHAVNETMAAIHASRPHEAFL